jgi:uncharacterized protein (TIGR02996 family)
MTTPDMLPVPSDGLAILRHIFHNKDDYAARLVYADWLDDNGDAETSEFIRMQVELKGHAELCPCETRQDFLLERTSFLLQSNGGKWIRTSEPITVSSPGVIFTKSDEDDREKNIYLFVNGFVDAVRARMSSLYDMKAAGLFDIHPISFFSITDREPLTPHSLNVSGWRNSAGRHPPHGDDIPGPVYDLLEGHVEETGGGKIKWYGHEAAARSALGEACLKYGRRGCWWNRLVA